MTEITITLTPAQILGLMRIKAQQAADAENAKLGPEKDRGFDCGYAYVHIHNARDPFAKFLKAENIGHKNHKRGWEVSAYDLHTIATQSYTVHYAAAQAAAHVLGLNGVDCHAYYRLD